MSRFDVQDVPVNDDLMKIQDEYAYDCAWTTLGSIEARLNQTAPYSFLVVVM